MGKRLSLCFQSQPYHAVDDFEDLELGKISNCSSDDMILSVEIDFDFDSNINPDGKM
tara:strand:- start:1484 stop:1654 length:171 start_codon:yes stop_codon:yes gene_type:complete